MIKIALGTDHSGFEITNELKAYLVGEGYEIVDFGTSFSEPVDYPIYADRVARSVQATGHLGILVCGSGIGMSMAANRYERIYAARCVNAKEAEIARRTGANILCLRGKSTSFKEMRAIVDAFLETEFSEEERHVERLILIDKLARANPAS